MYQTVFFISLGAWLLFEIWMFLRDRGPGPAKPEERRSVAALAIAVALAMNVPGLAPMFDVRRNFNVVFWIGIGLVWAGLLFSLWAVRTLGPLFSTRLVIQEGHKLINTGPYRWLRNPSYTGGIITLAGLGIALGNAVSLLLLLATAWFVCAARIRNDEKMLALAFGARWEKYRARTWRLIPFVW